MSVTVLVVIFKRRTNEYSPKGLEFNELLDFYTCDFKVEITLSGRCVTESGKCLNNSSNASLKRDGVRYLSDKGQDF